LQARKTGMSFEREAPEFAKLRNAIEIVVGVVAAAVATAGSADVKMREPAGLVRFYNVADSDFDVYSSDPTAVQQAWMRAHYFRMQTYSPYFDSRLEWYPRAWEYQNAYAIRASSPVMAAHPEWILRDADGSRLYIPWGCSNGTCPQYAADFGNPEFRADWIREARRVLAMGYIGLWIDDVNMTWRVGNGRGDHVAPIDPRTGAPMTLANWRRYFAEFMEEIRRAFPDVEIAHNAIWYAGNPADPYIRRQIAASDYFNLERGATDAGLTGGGGTFGFETFLGFVDAIHALGRGVILMDYGSTVQQREYALAAWLLISDGIDLMSSSQLHWTAPDNWWTGYDLNIGEAESGRYAADGVLRRDFQCGTVILNQPGGAPRSITLASPHRTIGGTQVNSVSLAAASAAILLKDCARP
jgi:hypothetical protein